MAPDHIFVKNFYVTNLCKKIVELNPLRIRYSNLISEVKMPKLKFTGCLRLDLSLLIKIRLILASYKFAKMSWQKGNSKDIAM